MSNNISSQNAYINNLNPQVQKRLNSEENFSAIDKEKLKQDTVQLTTKVKENAKENFITKTLKNFGIENPKKLFISLGLTIGTVVGGAFLGNKLALPTTKLGNVVDEAISNNKIHKNISKKLNSAKTAAKKTLKKSSAIAEVTDTLKNKKAKMKANFFRGYGQGFSSIFSLTVSDTLSKGLEKEFTKADGTKDIKGAAELLKKLTGDKKASEFANYLLKEGGSEKSTIDFSREFLAAIKENFNCKSHKETIEVLTNLKDGKLKDKITGEFIEDDAAKKFVNIDMVEKGFDGLMGSWWPVNIVNSIGKKLNKNWKPFCRGNLGDALIKFGSIDGKLADTKLGSLVQKSVILPTESITNFVNDKSGFGVMLCGAILGLYNNVQDAPKGKKAATIADDYIGTMGSIAITTPIAYAITYGLASLKNINTKDKGILTKLALAPLKTAGKVLGMGLDKYDAAGNLVKMEKKLKNAPARYLGGALRFITMMMVLSPIISKPINGTIHKIFGEPYDKMAEEQKKALEEQKKQIIPELGITQGELMEKMEKNPAAAQKLQTDANLAQKISQNPKLLIDLLDGKDINNSEPAKTNNQADNKISPAAASILNNRNNQINNKTNMASNEQNFFNKDKKQENKAQETQIDTATYIPSSKFSAPNDVQSSQSKEINDILAKSDKILAEAEKYI